MKNLLIFTSIILLSFQINHLLTTDSQNKKAENSKPSLTDAFASLEKPSGTPAFRNAVPIVKQTVALAKVSSTLTVRQTVKNNQTKVNVASSSYAEKMNKNLSVFHRNVKHSGNYLQLNAIQFKSNETKTLDTDQFNTIMQYADKLIFDKSLRLSIAGFTDNKGTEKYNEALSLVRAENIREYMIELGVKEDQLMVSSNGMADPVGDNDSEEGQAENRRVELALVQL